MDYFRKHMKRYVKKVKTLHQRTLITQKEKKMFAEFSIATILLDRK